MQPYGYALGKCLSAGNRSQIHEVRRERDDRPLLLKRYLASDLTSARRRAECEFEALRRLAGAGIAAALELIDLQDSYALVMERVPGATLQKWVSASLPTPESFLVVAIQLAEILARVHGARLLHRDVAPTNVMVDPVTRGVHVIDFEMARPVGTALHDAAGPVGFPFGGTLSYIAPESTGRMNRGVDERSDLYSLGATLYFALTGRPPFEGEEPLALMHAHIAKVPVPAAELRLGVPSTLSRIVSKLLKKSPEDRYQTADALASDLKACLDQLHGSGAIHDDFPLGTSDAPHRPLFSKALYGREREVQQLHESYTRAVRGTPTVQLLAGPPGIGKSDLVHSLHSVLVETGGYLALGKFDQFRRDLPYAGFVHAFESLAQQILSESDARLASWRDELVRGLGAVAGALAELVPTLAVVLGSVPAVPPLPPAEARARLALAVRHFLQAAASSEHPLVLCLDDLQWADAASRDLLREVLLGSARASLLVLGTYRDSEVNAMHPLSRLLIDLREQGVEVCTLELPPLSVDACAEMLATALGRTAAETRTLAACVARKTGNTPLLIQQFIYYMYDLGLVYFRSGVGWTWDDDALSAAKIPDTAVGMMTAKIARLSANSAAVLELASCAGDAFDLETLDRLSKRPREELQAALFALCEEGLIAPAPQGFRFVHDRVREAAQVSLSPEKRSALHHQAAWLLLERTPADALGSAAFEIADHLLIAGERLNEGERTRAIEVYLRAGNRALASGAAAAAWRYLEAAQRLFGDDHWRTHLPLGFEVFLQSAEAARQMQDFAGSLALLDTLERQPLDLLAAAQVAAKRIAVQTLRLPPDEVVQVILAVLRRFGVNWPSPHRWRIVLAIWRTERLLRGPLDERGFQPRRPIDPTVWAARLLVLSASGFALALHSRSLFVFHNSYMLRAYHRHGVAPGLQSLLACWASFRSSGFADARGAERYAEAARAWSDLLGDPISSARTDYLLNGFVYAFTRSRRSVLEPLRAVAERLFEVGQIEYGNYALLMRLGHMMLGGDTLERVQAEQETYATHTCRTSLGTAAATHALVLRLLRDPAEDKETPSDAERTLLEKSLRDPSGRFGSWSVWVMYLALSGRFEELLAGLSPEQEANDIFRMDLMFYRGVAAAALASGSRGGPRRRLLRLLRGSLKHLRKWTAQNVEGEHMTKALQAEYARVHGRKSTALTLYARAAEQASQHGCRHHAGFVRERRAALLAVLGRRSEERMDLERAVLLYGQWGAAGKASRLSRVGLSERS